MVYYNALHHTFSPILSFHVGFAINLQYLLSKPNVHMDSNSKNGYVESSFLMKLTTIDELEPKADNCSKVSCHQQEPCSCKPLTNHESKECPCMIHTCIIDVRYACSI